MFPAAGSNLAHEAGELSAADPFDGCEVVVSRQITNQRLAPVPMETRAAACAPDGDGGLLLWLSTQSPARRPRHDDPRSSGWCPGSCG